MDAEFDYSDLSYCVLTIDFIFLVSSRLNPETNPVPLFTTSPILWISNVLETIGPLFVELNLFFCNSFLRILISDSYSVA